jgi:serine/threonine-protein kinase
MKERMDAVMKKSELELIVPHYQLVRQIGQGGKSIVWLGEKDSRQYAIKFFDAKNEDTDSMARFEREIQFLYDNKAPCIVPIYSHGEAGNIKYHVTKYYSQTFRRIVEREIDWKSIFDYLIRLAESIKYLDEKGFVHRDIKPENILVYEGELVLCDFGIVKCEDATLTEKGDRLANAYYAAPEQLLKNGANDVTSAADIYALGMIINESFTKTRPDGANFAKIQEKYPFLYELDVLVDKMIEFNPSFRPSPVQAYCELMILYESLQSTLGEIYSTLNDASNDSIQIDDEICMQVYFANHLFQGKTASEIDGLYEPNWMRNISYSVNEEVLFYSILNVVYNRCKHKLEYEDNVADTHRYKPLDLENNPVRKALHDEFIKLFDKYAITREHKLLFNKALKYFDSCVDYHARELIAEESRTFSEIQMAKEGLLDAPILCIVNSLKNPHLQI